MNAPDNWKAGLETDRCAVTSFNGHTFPDNGFK